MSSRNCRILQSLETFSHRTLSIPNRRNSVLKAMGCGQSLFGDKSKHSEKSGETRSSSKPSSKKPRKVIDKTKNVWKQISSPSELTSSTPLTKEYKTGQDGIRTFKDVVRKHGYEWGEEIGSGSFGKVYKVTALVDNSLVACKAIDLKDGKSPLRDKKRVRDLKNELFTFEKVKHKHLIELYEHFIVDDVVYIFMEFADAGSVSAYVRSRDLLNERIARELFVDVFLGVGHLHQNRIAHRDLKMQNLLLETEDSRDFKVMGKVADFGLSAYSRRTDEVVKYQTARRGTPHYMAPEILDSYPNYDPFPVDIWALGVILFCMTNKSYPYGYDGSKMTDEKAAEMRKRIKEKKVKIKNETLSSDCKDLLSKLLTINPKERPSHKDIRKHSWVQDTILQRQS